MPAVPNRFSLRVSAAEGAVADPAAIEQFALDLRAELTDLGTVRVDEVSAGPAPEGARSLAILAVFEFIITMAQAGEAAARIVRAIREVANRYAEHRQRVRVTVADVEIDLGDASDAQLNQVAQAIRASAGRPLASVRSALVIANKQFDDPALTQLRAPGHDADALARVLGNASIGGFDVELLADADERTVRRRIAEFFAERSHDDVLLLHFSGHGVKDARGRLFLTARDTRLSLLGATGIPASFVNDQMAETQSKRVVLILDCCYSGAFARGTAVRGDDSVHVADEFGAGNGRIVLTASSATEYAFEGTELTRSHALPSAFTGALVGGLETGDADLDGDGEISIDELYEYTYRTVRASTPGQAPMKWSFGVEGSLVIARSVRPAALPQDILDDIASDRIVLRLEAVSALARLVETGKPGVRAVADAALVALRDNDDSARVRAAAGSALGQRASAVPPEPAEPPKPRSAPTLLVAAQSAAAPPHTAPAAPPPEAPPQPRIAPPAAGYPEVTPPAAVQPPALPSAGAQRGTAGASAAQPAGAMPAPAAAHPTVSADTATPVRAGGLVLAAAIITILAVIFDVLGSTTPLLTWYSLLTAAELAAAVLVLVTRRPSLTGLLIGLLAWEWLFPIVLQDNSFKAYLGSAQVPLVLGNLAALVALVICVVGVLRDGLGAPSAARWVRPVAGLVLAPLALIAAVASGQVITRAVGASMDTANGGVYLIGGLTGVVFALFLVLAPTHAVTRLLTVGWLFGLLIVAMVGSTSETQIDNLPLNWTTLGVLAIGSAIVTRPPRARVSI
jgi:hypothetical protein